MPESSPRPTCWVLAAPGAGDNHQLATLVELVGADARWFDPPDPVGRVLRDRAIGFRATEIPPDRAARYRPPWPDLVMIAGGRGVIDARRIRNASGGRTKIVCVGRPWAPLDWFDLVVTTPQYRLPPHPNVLTLDLPLNRPPDVDEASLAHWRAAFADLPRPLLGVLLGGRSGSFRFSRADAMRLADEIDRLAESAGGSAVVVGSPRTPPEALDAIGAAVRAPVRVHPFRADAPNPYAATLHLADALLVTSDSASMLAEACFNGKPVAVAELTERPRARLTRKLRAFAPVLDRATQHLTARGLWIPARDMPELHRRAAEAGRVTELEGLLAAPAEKRAPAMPLREVRERVRELLERKN
jgi:hypothetical protein